METQPGYDSLLGARIEKIGKDDPQQALAAVTPYISGNSAWIKVQSPGYLRIPALLNRLGVTRSATETELTVRLRSGELRRVTLPLASEPDPATEHENWRALTPASAPQKGRWAGVLGLCRSHTKSPSTSALTGSGRVIGSSISAATRSKGSMVAISLRPAEEISPTFGEYAAGRDPVLERAVALSR